MIITFLTGNLGRDCRVGSAGSTTVCNFAVATKSGYGDKQQTLWIDCALWGKQAESRLTEFLVKGQQVAVSGELGTREHEGKTYLTCRVDKIDLVGGRNDGERPAPRQDPAPQRDVQYAQTPVSQDFEDDIPFSQIRHEYII